MKAKSNCRVAVSIRSAFAFIMIIIPLCKGLNAQTRTDTLYYDQEREKIQQISTSENGIVLSEEGYYPGGKKRVVFKLLNDSTGSFLLYYENGKKKSEAVCVKRRGDWVPFGSCVNYYGNGKKYQIYDTSGILSTWDSLGILREKNIIKGDTLERYIFYDLGKVRIYEKAILNGENALIYRPVTPVEGPAIIQRQSYPSLIQRQQFYPGGGLYVEHILTPGSNERLRFYHENGTPDTSARWTRDSRDPLTFKRQGCWKEFYDNGGLKSVTCFLDDQRHGVEHLWFANGKLKARLEWQNDQNSGLNQRYYPNGQLEWTYYLSEPGGPGYEIGFYPDGQVRMQGSTISEKINLKVYYDRKGNVTHDVELDSNGIVRLTHYKKGKDRPDYSGSKKNGPREGLWTASREKGKYLYLANYKDSTLDGAFNLYDPNNKPRLILHFKNGLADGPFARLSANGDTIEKGAYEKGKKSGFWYKYREGGQVEKVTQYKPETREEVIWLERNENDISTFQRDTLEDGTLKLTQRLTDGTVYHTKYLLKGGQDIYEEFFDSNGYRIGRRFYDTGFANNYTLEETYPNGTIKLTGRFLNRRAEGEFRTFHENGVMASVERYCDGLKEDTSWYYDYYGKLAEVKHYTQGVEKILGDKDALCFCSEASKGSPNDRYFNNLGQVLGPDDLKEAFPAFQIDPDLPGSILLSAPVNQTYMEGAVRLSKHFEIGVQQKSRVRFTHCKHGTNAIELQAKYVHRGTDESFGSFYTEGLLRPGETPSPSDTRFLQLQTPFVNYIMPAGMLRDKNYTCDSVEVVIPVEAAWFLPERNGILILNRRDTFCCARPLLIGKTGCEIKIELAGLDLLPSEIPVDNENRPMYKPFHYPAHFEPKPISPMNRDNVLNLDEAGPYLKNFMGLVVYRGKFSITEDMVLNVRNWLIDEGEINGLLQISENHMNPETGEPRAEIIDQLKLRGFEVFDMMELTNEHYLPIRYRNVLP